MSDENKTPEEQPAEATPETAAAVEQQEAGEAAGDDPIEVLKAENADLKDRALRVMAEMENLRRRTEKEVKDARQYAVSGALAASESRGALRSSVVETCEPRRSPWGC